MKSTALAVALAVATVSTCLAEKEESYFEAAYRFEATHFCGKSAISLSPTPTIRKSC